MSCCVRLGPIRSPAAWTNGLPLKLTGSEGLQARGRPVPSVFVAYSCEGLHSPHTEGHVGQHQHRVVVRVDRLI